VAEIDLVNGKKSSDSSFKESDKRDSGSIQDDGYKYFIETEMKAFSPDLQVYRNGKDRKKLETPVSWFFTQLYDTVKANLGKLEEKVTNEGLKAVTISGFGFEYHPHETYLHTNLRIVLKSSDFSKMKLVKPKSGFYWPAQGIETSTSIIDDDIALGDLSENRDLLWNLGSNLYAYVMWCLK
jgi:hypothetical protein